MRVSLGRIIELLGDHCISTYSSGILALTPTSFELDSRKCSEGSLFFAFDGTKEKGTTFLPDVAKRKVCAAIVPSDYKGDSYGLLLIYVPNMLDALHKLTKEVIKLRKVKIIGVTGSVGKTTTKEYLAVLLSSKFKVKKTLANYNTEFHIPLALLNADGDEDFFVVEMGMTTKGDIAKKVSFAPTDYVIITPIALAHAENFSSLEEIAAEKGEIITDNTEHIIAHRTFLELRNTKTARPYPTDKFQKELAHLTIPSHFKENLEAAAQLAIYLGVSKAEILDNMQNLVALDHRFRQIEQGTNIVIDDSYNANPLSMKRGIEEIALIQTNRKKVAIIGSMKELGRFSEQAHSEVKAHLKAVFSQSFFVGAEWKEDALSYIALENLLKQNPLHNSLIFIKGSNSHALWNLLELIDEKKLTN